MSYTVTPQVAAGTIYAAQTITDFPGSAIIEATGATFITNGVVRGDAALVASSTSNDGTYIVLDVISETELEVFPAPTVEAGAGTVTTRAQNHLLVIEDEAAPTAASIETALGDARLFGLLLQTSAAAALNRFSIYSHVFREIRVTHTGATATDLLISHEVWVLDWQGRHSFTSTWTIRSPSSDPGTTLLRIGQQFDAGDRRAVGAGGVLLNGYPFADPGGQLEVRAGASFIHSADGAAATSMIFDSGQGDGFIVGCVIDGVSSTPAPAGEMDLIRNTIFTPTTGSAAFVPLGVVNEAKDLLLAFATASGGVFFGAVEVVAAGVEAAAATYATAPLIISFASSFAFEDPKEDYTPGNLFQLFSGMGRKTYTFNPRFTDIDAVNGATPQSGLEVTIIKLTDGHYVRVNSASAGDYTLDIDGDKITYTATGGDTVTTIRNGLVAEINSVKPDRTATAAANGAQVGGASDTLIVLADVADVPFTIFVQDGDMTLDPAPTGAGALGGDDYREGEITGSPFTTDANGRINTDGVQLTRFIGYEDGVGVRFINCTYRVIVEGAGFAPYDRTYTPRAPLLADIPIADAYMGEKNPGQ